MKYLITSISIVSALALCGTAVQAAQAKPPAKPKTAPLTIKQPTKAPPATKEYTGVIEAVGLKDNSLTFKEQDYIRVFTCTKDTKLTAADGKTAITLKDLKVGQSVKLQYYLNELSESVCAKVNVVPAADKTTAKDAGTNSTTKTNSPPKKSTAKKR